MQANLLACARTASSLSNYNDPTAQQPSRPLWLGLALGLALEFRVGVVADVSRSRKYLTVEQKISYSLVAKPYFIETAVSFYAGASEEVRLRGQIYVSWAGCLVGRWSVDCFEVGW